MWGSETQIVSFSLLTINSITWGWPVKHCGQYDWDKAAKDCFQANIDNEFRFKHFVSWFLQLHPISSFLISVYKMHFEVFMMSADAAVTKEEFG